MRHAAGCLRCARRWCSAACLDGARCIAYAARCKQEWAAYNDQKVLDYQSIGRPSDANRTPIGRQVAAECNMQHAHCNTHNATCNTHTATCNTQPMTGGTQEPHAAQIMHRTASIAEHVDASAVLSLPRRCEAACIVAFCKLAPSALRELLLQSMHQVARRVSLQPDAT